MNIPKLKETLLRQFDKIYILTMSNRSDRRELIEKELTAMQIDLPDETNFIRYYYGTTFPYNNIIADAFNNTGKGRFTKPNEYDCARNHYAMIKICYDLGYEHCMILEDDILFLNNADKLADYFNELPNNYDIVQFGGFTADPYIKQYTNTENKWVKHKKTGVWTTAGYAMSRRGMEYFLAFMDGVSFWVADGPLYKAPLNDKIINVYLSNIPLVIQADKNAMPSDIRDKQSDTIDYNNQNLYESDIDLNDYFHL